MTLIVTETTLYDTIQHIHREVKNIAYTPGEGFWCINVNNERYYITSPSTVYITDE